MPRTPGTAPPTSVDLTLAADPLSVRDALGRLMVCQGLADLSDEDRGTVELLLAEAMNNVVEHAYARWPGEIAVAIHRDAAAIAVRITDQGLPMPDATPPEGRLPAMDADDLPEGGFGWFLIRTLAQDLTYRRQGEVNELTFCIPVNTWEG